MGEINSILDNDLYKFSMSYAYMKLYPRGEGTFTFTDRSNEKWTQEQLDKIKHEIAALSMLKLTDAEFNWACDTMGHYIDRAFWEWLRQFRFAPEKINVYLDEEQHLQINVTDAQYKATLYEVPILAIVSYSRSSSYKWDRKKVVEIAKKKALYAVEHNLKFAEFGTRRRFKYDVHDLVLQTLVQYCPNCLTGTSNVHMAMKYGLKPIGTMAHEWIMFHAGLFGFRRANYLALEDWVKVYDGNLGIALIDTYTTESFLRKLTLKQAKLFDGGRQDSGDEYKIGNMIIERYKEFNIDPKSKTVCFSNALTMEKLNDITEYFRGRLAGTPGGIGTHLTNDPGIKDYKPANIVMKLTRCRMSAKDPWEDVIKISDDLGKHMGNPELFEMAKKELHLNID